MWGYLRQQFINHLRANIVAYFFIVLIFLIGIVMGALSVKILPEEQKTELVNYLTMFFNGLHTGTGDISSIFAPVMYSNAKVIILIWLLGFTIVGVPFVLFLLFTRGFIIGFTVGFLVNEYIARGLLFALVAVLPHNFFAIPAVFIASVAAINFSLMLLRRKSYNKNNLLYDALGYSCLSFVLLLVMLVAGLIEIYISPVFMKLMVSMFLKDQ
ncbi:putative membrane protein [Propionispora sp. 2/2-37]|uniref:stage II sporulation protein M n=1 Tax=Propionispora sp. 2/2-37 TaxID=1677858 RepID=UPI0006BB6994|nr:stage II sporulation protein M [Propionispora sp. 2/2-37]CUH94047.1 putative membrane protein [Propionispora sp. 2/2-37]